MIFGLGVVTAVVVVMIRGAGPGIAQGPNPPPPPSKTKDAESGQQNPPSKPIPPTPPEGAGAGADGPQRAPAPTLPNGEIVARNKELEAKIGAMLKDKDRLEKENGKLTTESREDKKKIDHLGEKLKEYQQPWRPEMKLAGTLTLSAPKPIAVDLKWEKLRLQLVAKGEVKDKDYKASATFEGIGQRRTLTVDLGDPDQNQKLFFHVAPQESSGALVTADANRVTKDKKGKFKFLAQHYVLFVYRDAPDRPWVIEIAE
jgi:hypothetical protein